VTVGQQRDGYRRILEGLHPGDVVATEGAVFLNNMLAIARSQIRGQTVLIAPTRKGASISRTGMVAKGAVAPVIRPAPKN
jgi:hypothetical protein